MFLTQFIGVHYFIISYSWV